jgi:zinc transporter 1/2/3
MLASFALQLLEIATIAHLKKLSGKGNVNNPDNLNEKNDFSKGNDIESSSTTQHSAHGHEDHHVHSSGLLEHEDAHRYLGTYMLELGIVIHSIFVGLALATTSESEFITLLIAIVFHQVKSNSSAALNADSHDMLL